VKETGCGISGKVGARLKALGVRTVDTSGAGGTSWVGVETKRAKATKALGERFWDWGIPTAASVAQLADLGVTIIATGGMRDGLMIARAIAIGATAGGIARPFLQAHAEGGIDGVRTLAKGIIEEIRVACLLTGSHTPADLAKAPLVVGPRLDRWIPSKAEMRGRMGA
jgi:isopentenyl-diphosphate delta-isomerase